jgi:histidinol-phosphate phosphatase family protein
MMSFSTFLLDRDGTINLKAPDDAYVTSPADVHLLPGAAAAIRRLNDAGRRVIVVTNQRAVARGLMSMEQLDAVHARLTELLGTEGARLDGILVCPHERDACDCRKPEPGLLLRAVDEHGVDLDDAVMVGDSRTDIQAGKAAGVATIKLGEHDDLADVVAVDLASAVDHALGLGDDSVRLADVEVGYVVRLYPKVSHTFIQREVQALRSLGATVDTYSLRRPPPEEVLSDADRVELARTACLLPVSAWRLARAHATALARNPGAYAATLVCALRSGPRGLPSRVRQLLYFAQAVLLHATVRTRRPRHLHAHLANVATDVTWLAAELGNRTGSDQWTWSFTMHGPTELHEMTRFNLARKVAAADLVVCISDFCRAQLMAITEPGLWPKLVVVHCGVEPDELPVRGSGRVAGAHILSVGRLVPEKAQSVLLDAIAGLVERGIEVSATVVGDGPDMSRLVAQCAALGLDQRVTFTGALGQDQLRGRWEQADVFCLPSFDEGVPVVLMEAMACGIPVVTTRIAGIPELVDDGVNGVLVPPGRADLLAAALEALLNDPETCRRLGAAGRETVVREFDVRTEAAELGQSFRSLSADSKRPQAE